MRTTYFMIRVQRPDAQETGSLNGMVERLGTGEKQQFSSDQDLLRLLRSWPSGSASMQAGDSAKAGGEAAGSDGE